MKRISLREFGSQNLDGFEFVFNLVNQPKKSRNRRRNVIEDKRVFGSYLISLNPDCIKFCGDRGSCMTIDGVSHVCAENDHDNNMFFFEIVCDKQNRFVFLAKKT